MKHLFSLNCPFLLLAVTLGCAALGSFPQSKPFPHVSEHPHVVLHSDAPIGDAENIADELANLRDQIGQKLAVIIPERPVHVYLFDSEPRYREFADRHFPEFGNRRSIFVHSTAEMTVYAHRGPHLTRDLRHEATHAYLHASRSNIPLWLDEGLAEYFEEPAGDGLNREHVQLLRDHLAAGDWHPDPARLETLTDPAALTLLDYAESWAWVYLAMKSGWLWSSEASPQQVPGMTLAVGEPLRTDYRPPTPEEAGSTPTSFSDRLAAHLPDPAAALIAEIRSLR